MSESEEVRRPLGFYPVNEDGEVIGGRMEVPWEYDTVVTMLLPGGGVGIRVDAEGRPLGRTTEPPAG